MSNPQSGDPSPQPNLQFDRAERTTSGGTAGMSCVQCNQPVTGSYYEANGRIVCPACRNRILAGWNNGSGSGRFAKAFGLGLAAAAAGAALYYAIAALTGYEFGLVAIVVGLLVGGAVRRGSNGRGGWRYQALAMCLTYSAIVVTYVPQIIKAATQQRAAATADSTRATHDTATPATAPAGRAAAPRRTRPGIGSVLVALVVLFAFALAVPILAGIDNIIGLVIIGFALYEAWKLNKRIELRLTGPYRAGAPRAAPI